MKGIKRFLATVTMLAMFICCAGVIPTSAQAVTVLRSITIKVLDSGDYRLPTIESGNYDRYKLYDAPTWSKEEGELVAGETVTATFIVEPQDGYEIRLADGKNSIKLTGNTNATVTSWTRDGNKHTIKISWVVNGALPAPESAYWDANSPWMAKWDSVKNATKYQVKLYRNNVCIVSYETKNRSCDFTKELASEKCADQEGVYFMVRAIADTGRISDSAWVESDMVYDWTEIWYHAKDKGITWNGSLHEEDDNWYDDYKPSPAPTPGPSAVNGWVGRTGEWYFYQGGNLIKNSWVSDNGYWYYVGKTGKMVTGWFKDNDGRWYYLNPSSGGPEGSCVKGWAHINDKWYYMYPSYGVNNGYYYKEAEMAANTWIDHWYVGSDGAWTGQYR